jgi:hypothetical protein
LLYQADLKKSKKSNLAISDRLQLLTLSKLTINILGSWAYVEELAYYIDLVVLPI